jgi:hypothetical protein
VYPGKRFLQVKKVALSAVLLWDLRVEVVPDSGKTKHEEAKRACMTSLKADNEGHMLHEMIDPESVGLRWVKRA